MDRIHLNQTALSLGYIAIKRIRQLESSKSARVPASPLLRHVLHVKILAACVEQVGPDEIIEYEINQDCGVGEPTDEQRYDVEEDLETRRLEVRNGTDDDVFERQGQTSTRSSTARQPLSVISEDSEEAESSRPVTDELDDFDREGDYSMDDLYDVYDDDDWETTSTVSEDDSPCHIESVPSTSRDQAWSPSSIDTDSDEDEVQTPPSMVTSRSPPLDITMRHPITHELNKREQYRRQEEAASDLSRAFVQQIEDVLCRDIRYHTFQGIPGELHSPRISLFA